VVPIMPSRLPPVRRPHRRDPSLRSRCSTRPSTVLRSPRTPAARRSTSPSAYTRRLALTRAAQTGLSCSASLRPRVSRPIPRKDLPHIRLRTRRERHGLRRDMSGSAPSLFICRGCRLHYRCDPRSCSLRRGSRRPAQEKGISPLARGLLPGAPALTGTGLAPAGKMQHEPRSRSPAGP
jgi:hypothetical protein